MATLDLNSLFGQDPRLLQQSMDLQMAKLSPEERLYMMGAQTGRSIGQGLGSLFGVDVEDPTIKKASALRALASEFDTNTAEGLLQYAQAASKIDPRVGVLAAQQAKVLREQTAKAAKAEFTFTQEEKLRQELANLGPNASEADILKVVTKYGPADKVLTALQTSADKQANREQQAALQKERLEAQAQRDRERAQDRKDLAVLVSSLKTGAGQGKPLSAVDIKEINKIKSNVDTANTTIEQADNFINLIDEGKMQFGAGENLLGVIRRGVGKANESDLNKVEFEQFVTASVNSILNLAKGPQTDQDAKRAEKQIIDALNKNDSKAVKRGLESLKKVWEGAKATDMSALELYSSERGGKQLTPTTEGKVPTVPKATKRFNPATGKIESL